MTYLSVVQGNGPGLALLNGMLLYVDLLAMLSQHFEGLLLQSNYHPNCLLATEQDDIIMMQ